MNRCDGATHTFTINLTDAVVVAISRAGGDQDLFPEEQITVIAQAFLYQHVGAGTTHTQNCVSP